MAAKKRVSGAEHTRARVRARGAAVKVARSTTNLVGRPTTRSPEMAVRICTLIAEGNSLRRTCEAPGVPSLSTVMAWLAEDQEFSGQYERARTERSHALAEEMLDVARTPELGVKTVRKGKKVETTTGDMIEHRRLKVDVLKWHASKMLPERYGERVGVKIEGSLEFAQKLVRARERAIEHRRLKASGHRRAPPQFTAANRKD